MTLTVSIEKFNRLAEKANMFYYQSNMCFTQARDSWQHGLEYAIQCGEALLEIKSQLAWGEFQNWAEERFEGRSYNTASDYMRVAKAFINKDPKLEEAKKAGKELNSINAIKQILRNPRCSEKPEDKIIENTETNEASFQRQSLRENFAIILRSLNLYELRAFDQRFEEYFQKIYIPLYNDVCNELDTDLNEWLLENEKLYVKEGSSPRSWKDFERQGARAAVEDMNVMSIRNRIDSVPAKAIERKKVRLRILLSLNTKRMPSEWINKTENKLNNLGTETGRYLW
ncbi:MAG: DUF3102 domain-containing protein [Sedimentisphaerales bacterium]